MLAVLGRVSPFPRLKIERRLERRRLNPRCGADQVSMEMIDIGLERGGPLTVPGLELGAFKDPSRKSVERRLSLAAVSLSASWYARSSLISSRAWETRRRSFGFSMMEAGRCSRPYMLSGVESGASSMGEE